MGNCSGSTNPTPTTTTTPPVPSPQSTQARGYLSVTVPKIPRKTSIYHFESCCCTDEIAAILEALYQFVLTKKAANPAILGVQKRYSDNSACNALQVDFNLLNLTAQTEQDARDIWLKYLWLLGF